MFRGRLLFIALALLGLLAATAPGCSLFEKPKRQSMTVEDWMRQPRVPP